MNFQRPCIKRLNFLLLLLLILWFSSLNWISSICGQYSATYILSSSSVKDFSCFHAVKLNQSAYLCASGPCSSTWVVLDRETGVMGTCTCDLGTCICTRTCSTGTCRLLVLVLWVLDTSPHKWLKGEGKGASLDIAPLRSESPLQKRSGMTRVLKGFHSFTCTPTRSSAIGMSHMAYLPLPSQPQLVLIYRPRRDGRLSRPWCEVAQAEIRLERRVKT